MKLNKKGTFSIGRVKQAATTAATRRSRRVILRTETHVKNMFNLRIRGVFKLKSGVTCLLRPSIISNQW